MMMNKMKKTISLLLQQLQKQIGTAFVDRVISQGVNFERVKFVMRTICNLPQSFPFLTIVAPLWFNFDLFGAFSLIFTFVHGREVW